MSTYLSAIAARSIQSDNFPLMPSAPATSAVDTGLMQDFTDSNFQDDALQQKSDTSSLIPAAPLPVAFGKSKPQDLSVGDKPYKNLSQKEQAPENTEQVQPGPHQQLQPVKLPGKAETVVTQNSIVIPYISRHVERMIVNENSGKGDETIQGTANTSNKIRLDEEDSFSQEKEPTKNFLSNASELKAGTLLNKTEPKGKTNDLTKLKKTPVLSPANKGERPAMTKNDLKSLVFTRMTPIEPAPGNSIPNNNRNNPVTPKLVIGKITVEILPPVAQPSAKIITRLVQPSYTENHSKINRLNFGLGQI